MSPKKAIALEAAL
jgi:hypothetical protein